MSYSLELKNIKPGETLWDDIVKGLHARALPSGKVSFYVFYRTKNGTQRRPKIGEHPISSVIEARYRAKKILAQVLLGFDPKGQWDASKKELTVKALFDLVFKEHYSLPQYVHSGWDRKVLSLYNKHIHREFGSVKLSVVRTAHVHKWHAVYLKKSVTNGNHSLAVLSKLFSYAVDHGLCAFNPCIGVKKHTTKKRSRFATATELRSIFKALDKYANVYPKEVLFLYTILYTGARPISITRANVRDLKPLDGGGHILEFKGKSTQKTGQNEVLVFPKQLTDLFKKYETYPFGQKMPHKLWAIIQEETGLADLWARDLRRTFATTGFNAGLDLGLVGRLLNHKDIRTTDIYARLFEDRRVYAVNEIAETLERFKKGG